MLYQNDFSGPKIPGWSRDTVGDNIFARTWSVTPSLVSESDNQYARFDINIPSLPSNPSVRWNGGFLATVSSMTTLPAQWQLSFDVVLPAAEPLQIKFRLNPGSQYSFWETTMTYSVTPAGVGWQRVVIDQNTAFSLGKIPSGFLAGTFLDVSLLSHDPNGNPLTISQVGTHHFCLDNVTLQSVPEPSILAFFTMAGALFFGTRRNRTICCSGLSDCASVDSCASGAARH